MKLHHQLLFIALFFSAISFAKSDKILVTETTVKVNTASTEELYFGFAEGDQIIFNFELVKGKNLKELEVFAYPNSSVFMDFKTKKVKDKVIQVNQAGIYKFKFKNGAIKARVCRIKIERIPASPETADFNSAVFWETINDTTFYTVQEKYLVDKKYVTKTILPSTEYYINSGRNALLQGGKSRITFPVTLPKNTIEWYYQFSASRNKGDIDKARKGFSLISDLSGLIDQTGYAKFGIDALTQPPGANFCDIYLFDHPNSRAFEAKNPYNYWTSGTRENIKSGIIKISQGGAQQYYIGIKNPDSGHGIHVGIEVVAITLEENWGLKDIPKFKVKSWKKPYLKN